MSAGRIQRPENPQRNKKSLRKKQRKKKQRRNKKRRSQSRGTAVSKSVVLLNFSALSASLRNFSRTYGYFFSSLGGGAVAGGFAGWLACAGGGSPRMPSLNSRTPCPRPFITSGILRPPNSTKMTMAIINKCIGLSHMGYLPFAPEPLQRKPHRALLPNHLEYSTPRLGRRGAAGDLRRALAARSGPERRGIYARENGAKYYSSVV